MKGREEEPGGFPMQVMVLAAGFGDRLKPLTALYAKPTLPLFGETVLGRLLKALAAAGADRIIFNTHHLAEQVARAAEEACPLGVELLQSHEETIQGTAGALREAAGLVRDEPLVVVNADVVHDVDLARLVALHRARKALVTLVCRADLEAEGYGALGIDGEARVARFLGWAEPGADSTRIKTVMFTGIQVVEPSVLSHIPEGFVSTTEATYPELLRAGEPVYGMVHEGYWMDIGTPARYLKVHRDILRGKTGPPPPSGWRPFAEASITKKEPNWVADDAAIEARSVLGPYAVLGSGCRLGPGSIVERSVLMEGVGVGPRAVVEGCIVAPQVQLPPRESFIDSIVTLDDDGAVVLTPIGTGGEAA